jgi:hypothetical protein
MHEIKSFGVMQTAKVMAVIYAILAAVIGFFLALSALFRGHPVRAILALFGLPILYGVFSFIFVAILCLLYNEIARRVGGVEIELNER